jgi:hypothetical protein
MGRKPAPQPLTLPHSGASSGSPVPATATATDQTSGSDDGPLTAETAPLEAAPSPADSNISPRPSPLSIPSSKFASNKRPQTAGAKASPQPLVSDGSSTPQHPSQPIKANPEATYPPTASSFKQQPFEPPLENPKLRHVHTEGRKPAKTGFFHFNKASKTSNYLPAHAHHRSESSSHSASRGSDNTSTTARHGVETSQSEKSLQRSTTAHPSQSDLSLSSIGDHDTTSSSAPSSAKKAKAKPFGLLNRNKSFRDKNHSSTFKEPPAPLPPAPTASNKPDLNGESLPLRTAPVAVQDRAYRDMMNATVRNRSADRAPARSSSRDKAFGKEHSHGREARVPSSLNKENGSSAFLSGLRSSSTKGFDMISKGLFGKGARGVATLPERDHPVEDDKYELKVINLPLVQQTRKTRISKRLEMSRDKTEFWMPAFPWRAIDYLNYKGCEVEGLYRVPGSGPQIKKWQRRFDEEHDVNLFEEEDLYDINIVGSMLKAWLRELPDELFPKAAQDKIARECAGAEEVPQMLVDELSELPPFNYYLLFAITCHLSLLLAHSEKNKMDFRNLCICFQPCMKIDAFSFKFLVCDWRDCWKGCKNEAKYIEEEYRLFKQPPPPGLTDSTQPSQTGSLEERKASTSDSSYHSAPSMHEKESEAGPKSLTLSTSHQSVGSKSSSISTALTPTSERQQAPGSADLRPLSPIQPLSPMGFSSHAHAAT